MSLFLTYRPQSPLSSFINIFWLYKGYYPPHEMERVLPDGTMQLIINLDDDVINVYDQKNYARFNRFNGSVISGPHSVFTIIDTASQASTIGVHFKPGGAYPIFKLPANQLRNTHVSLETLWGPKAAYMRDELLEAETPDSKFKTLEQYLMDAINKPVLPHPAVAFALKHFQAFPYQRKIADVTKQIGLSPRRFIQVFKNEVGMTPKRFCRIQRFQDVLQLIGSGEQINWSEIALTSGYYDQAHFIHDFRSFSGINPTIYRTKQNNHQNHVPLHQ